MAKVKATDKKATSKKTPAAKKQAAAENNPPESKVDSSTGEKRTWMTTDEFSKQLGVTNARISQLYKEGVVEPLPSGSRKEGHRWPFNNFIKVARYYRELSDSRGSRETEEMKRARERQLIARAKKEELELLGYEGDLHKAEDIERVIGAALSRLRVNLLAISKGVAPQLRNQADTNVIAERIHERIVRALNEVVSFDIDELLAKEE